MKKDSLVSVTCNYSFLEKRKISSSYNPFERPRRQSLNMEDMEYRENGSIYISKTNNLINSKCRISGKITLFKMYKNSL